MTVVLDGNTIIEGKANGESRLKPNRHRVANMLPNCWGMTKVTDFNGPGIYEIRHLPSEERYIGRAIKVRSRITEHKNALRNRKHVNASLQSAWNRFPEEGFRFDLVWRPSNRIRNIRENLESAEHLFINYDRKLGKALNLDLPGVNSFSISWYTSQRSVKAHFRKMIVLEQKWLETLSSAERERFRDVPRIYPSGMLSVLR